VCNGLESFGLNVCPSKPARLHVSSYSEEYRFFRLQLSVDVPLSASALLMTYDMKRSDWVDITEGRNYQSRGGWLLLLPSSLVLPLLRHSGGPPVLASLGGEGGGGGLSAENTAARPTVTLMLTLWLAEPSYKPAFYIVAQTLAPAVSGSGRRGVIVPSLRFLSI
jgi:hypothetical protein